jgi:hypothetical protein
MTGTRRPADPTPTGRINRDPIPASRLSRGRSVEPGRWGRLTWLLARRALLRPHLALELLRTVWAFRGRHWYRTPPFLPIPPLEYVRWRMYTAYGDENAVPSPDDVVRFARWRREVMHL